MKFTLYTNALSAHQIPLAREVAKLVGADNFRYIYTSKEGQKLQESNATDSWIEYLPIEQTNDWLENADVMLVGGIRPIDLMERRLVRCKTTLYMSERWFKPVAIGSVLSVPGCFRLFDPKYRAMAKRFAMMFKSPYYRFLPIGPWSLLDMKLICDKMSVAVQDNQIIKWGDFVEASKFSALPVQEASNPSVRQLTHSQLTTPNSIRVLWVGRLLNLKRVDTIVRAVGEHVNLKRVDNSLPKITLDIYGMGPEERRLKKLASKYGDAIKFYPPVPIGEVRALMREHDIYVLASNAYEGWGAVVSEALEEGMKVIGTYEAGASAAILPETNLFHSGDWKSLAKKLTADIPYVPIGEWSAERAAKRLFRAIGE